MAEILAARQADWQALGSVIAEAFLEDPVSAWVFRNPREAERTFQLLARVLYLPRGRCWMARENGRLLGGALWLPPGGSKDLPLLTELQYGLASLLRHGPGPAYRALSVDAGMKAARPTSPHWYLFAVGVLPAARGRGLGRALLTAQLEGLAGEAAYLENSNPRNASLYQGLGFVPGQAFAPARSCPQVVPMWRAGPGG